MQQEQGLTKAAAMMAVMAALATMLAVYLPAAPSARDARVREAGLQRIPVPATTPRGGAGAAQGRGAVARRREAGGGRATNSSVPIPNSSGTQQ